VYLANPLVVAVSMFHRAFWYDGRGKQAAELLPDLWARGAITLVICGVILALGQYTFRRLEGRFAAEL
jgi:ABC-2 type transport system permease protein